MSTIKFNEYFFPVIGGAQNGVGRVIVNQVYGTASYIGNNMFITAAHSIENANSNDLSGIGFIEPSKGLLFKLNKDFELFPELDIGIVQTEPLDIKIQQFKFSNKSTPLLKDVWSAGFPHAYDKELKNIKNRALMGYIVSSTNFREFKSNPLSYELSFHCPVGISGAPLLIRNNSNPLVIGYIVGNTNSEILILREKEIEIEKESGKEKETVFEKTETTKYGIAIDILELLEVNSRLLGNKTLATYFSENKLLMT